jgi:group I intron endonuclease
MIFKCNKNKSGIYGVLNLINGKIYVGKTKNFSNRFTSYKLDFKNKRLNHMNNDLLYDMEKFGFENFNFITLEECSEEFLFEKEFFWIESLKTCDDVFGYNLRRDCPEGMITHEKTSKKISNRLKKEWSNGLRSLHGEKLKDNWKNNTYRKDTQSKLLSKTLTKYEYVVIKDSVETIVNYKGLVELNLQTVLSNFHRRKSDDVFCKGFRVIRRKIND